MIPQGVGVNNVTHLFPFYFIQNSKHTLVVSHIWQVLPQLSLSNVTDSQGLNRPLGWFKIVSDEDINILIFGNAYS